MKRRQSKTLPLLKILIRPQLPHFSRHRFILFFFFLALVALFIYLQLGPQSVGQQGATSSSSSHDQLDSIPSHDMPEIPSLKHSSGFSLHVWLDQEKALGWCNSALGTIHECHNVYSPCIYSPINSKIALDTFEMPFTVSWGTNEKCKGAIRGQLSSAAGHSPQVSFILTPSSRSDHECARLVMETFVTAREAESIEFSVYHRLDPLNKIKPWLRSTARPPSATVKALKTLRKHFNTHIVYQSGRVNRGMAMQQAVVAASGLFLIFLGGSEMTVSVTPGWLTALLFTADRMPLFGAVGCLNLDPRDRSISEAGGLLFSDGLTTVYSKEASTQGKQMLYARRTDFATTNCLMMKRQVFLALDGFDLSSVSELFKFVNPLSSLFSPLHLIS